MLSKEPKGRVKSDGSIRAENTLLKGQLKEMEAIKMKLAKAEQDSKVMEEQLATKQDELNKAMEGQVSQQQKAPPPPLANIQVSEPMPLPNLAGTYRTIKALLEGRQ